MFTKLSTYTYYFLNMKGYSLRYKMCVTNNLSQTNGVNFTKHKRTQTLFVNLLYSVESNYFKRLVSAGERVLN